ncbi:MAG: hypothetical protein LKH33_03295 [Acetobacter sp.]|jgi:hypothetical protein|nr:hypothetical protein [Acetobacter sp.]MCI1319417.1 hypothetical protein [Acetobacter sp.]MCI1412732.1 hypothetical protein [Acetobacter sp.]MCI1484822.1 hypothetical protein [Acetobacter sp.]MCI1515912.1 hypothetical protein [Acetobacter sp.]
MKRTMSDQIKNDRNKDNDDKDYHFSKGKTGSIVRWLLRIGKRPETVDETVTAPAFLTLMAFLWADKHPDCGQFPIWVYVASVAAAGIWYGLVRGGPEFIRPLFRGILTGGLTAMALYLCLPHIAQPQEWSSISGNMIMIGMDLFFFAHALSAIAREFLLTTEAQWQKGIQKRSALSTLLRRRKTTNAMPSGNKDPRQSIFQVISTFTGYVAETESLEGKSQWLGLTVNIVRALFTNVTTNAISVSTGILLGIILASNSIHHIYEIIYYLFPSH